MKRSATVYELLSDAHTVNKINVHVTVLVTQLQRYKTLNRP